jgi:hypothetical protein
LMTLSTAIMSSLFPHGPYLCYCSHDFCSAALFVCSYALA